MKSHQALKYAREFIRSQKGHIAPSAISEEELNPHSQDDMSLAAHPLEPTTTCYQVGYKYPEDTDCSEFSFFQDGRQRTVPIGFIPATYGSEKIMIPVHYFVVAAVILKRSGRRLALWSQPEIRQGILVEKSLVPDQYELNQFEHSGLVIETTDALGGDYYSLRSRALQRCKELRLQVEDRLIRQWRNSSESSKQFLVVDGTLMNFRDERNVERCVGVSKSFGTRYFNVSENHMILQMREFERSWTFRFHDPEADLSQGARERVSWYLRLRTRPNVDPEFGLVRVEISRRFVDNAPELAERFSKSLLSERLPTSFPFPRWDKHLYPIRECENYLSTIMPSITTISSSMKGVF